MRGLLCKELSLSQHNYILPVNALFVSSLIFDKYLTIIHITHVFAYLSQLSNQIVV